MLTRKESEVMQTIYNLCKEDGRCLISPCDLINNLPMHNKYNEEKLDKILKELELDDYFEIITSDRKGEKMYVITLHNSGFAYKRSSTKLRRDIFLKILWTIISAALAFLVTMILKRLFFG